MRDSVLCGLSRHDYRDMTSHTRVKVPPPKPALTVRTRSVTGCVWQTTWRAPVWRCALLYSDRPLTFHPHTRPGSSPCRPHA